MVTGAAAGWLFPEFSRNLGLVPEIFLRLIRAILGPLLVGVLVTGLAEAGGIGGVGRIGWRALVFFELSTSLALAAGWGVVALFGLGAGLGQGLVFSEAGPVASESLQSLAVAMAPASIADALIRTDVMQILVFCFLLGTAAAGVRDKAAPLLRLAAALSAACFEFTRFVMWLAPAAVFAAMAGTVARSAPAALESLGAFVAAAWGAQASFLVLVLGGSLMLARVPLRAFVRAVEEPVLVAFATTSSAAAIPKAMEALETLGVPRRVYGVVTPLSLSLHLTGSTLHLAMCAFFAAHAAGMTLSAGQQLLILLTLKFTSKGVAGIPRANFLILTGLFASFGLPSGVLPVLLGIDALIDPVRTTVNVLGHCAASPVVERWAAKANAGAGSVNDPELRALPDSPDAA